MSSVAQRTVNEAGAAETRTDGDVERSARRQALRERFGAEYEESEKLLADIEAGRVTINTGEPSDFERWFLSQPPEWIVEIDAMAREPHRPQRPSR